MTYLPPVGGAPLSLTGEYVLPVGGAVLSLGATVAPERAATLIGETLAPVGLLSAMQTALAALAGETLAPTGRLVSTYDANLLDAMTVTGGSGWQAGQVFSHSLPQIQRDGARRLTGERTSWQAGAPLTQAQVEQFTEAAPLARTAVTDWQPGALLPQTQGSGWTEAQFAWYATGTVWTAAGALRVAAPSLWIDSPRVTADHGTGWTDADARSHMQGIGWRDGPLGARVVEILWGPAAYPGNAPNPPQPPRPPEPDLPWLDQPLSLRCPEPWSGRLTLGDAPCGFAKIYYPIRRSYLVLNTASLTRLPERTPLPCTSLTVATDSDSWCWSLTANLSTAEAWALVEPLASGYPREVEATINGRVWQFALDNADPSRAFARSSVTLRGRSRSAWLDAPYQPSITVTEKAPRTAQQIAEAALEGTGWGLIWQLDDWPIPPRTYSRQGPIIGRVGTIIKTVGGGLYSDPTLALLTAYPQYPQPAWLWAALTPVISIPEAALGSLALQPQQSPSYNGLYLAGTQAGKLVIAKIAGTDGTLRPEEPIIDSLFCDADGIAARQRAIYELSQSGFSYEATLETLYPAALGLIRPGQYLEAGALRGMVRGVSIRASWSGYLSVRQTLTLEQRELS